MECVSSLLNSPGVTLYEIYEINELSQCRRTDTDNLERGIFMAGVPSGPIPDGGTGGVVGGSART
jgi:hypothetical protein